MNDKPNKRRFGKKNPKRRWNRNRTQGGRMPANKISRGVFRRYNDVDPFPPSQLVKFTYGQTVVLTSGTGGIYGSEQVYRLNSLYDPDLTGLGHQPYGHDEMANLYRNYKVVGVGIDIKFSSPTDNGIVCAAAILNPNDTFSTTGKATDTLAEKTMCSTKILNNTGSQKVEMKQYLPMHTIVGVTKEQFKNSIGAPYAALFGASPVDQARLAVNVCSIGSASGAGVSCRIKLTYYTQVYERKVQDQS